MAEILNNELNKYWSQLDTQERDSVLSVMKSFLRLKSKNIGKDSQQQQEPEIPKAVQQEVIQRLEYLKQNPESGICEEEMENYLTAE